MTFDLTGKKIVVTGINGGIAMATAKLLLELGAEVVGSARTEAKLEKALHELGDKASGYIMDLLDTDSIAAFFEKVGSFDHLVTPASTSMFAPVAEMDFEAAREILEAKQWGQLHCVHHAAKQISKSGSITLFSGTVTQKPLPGASMFAAVGGATEAAGRIWALELAPIRVNTVVPGIIDTPAWPGLMGEDAAKETFENFAGALPAGRVGTGEDIAKSVAFLIDNGFVNGVSLVVDGGHRLI